MKINQCSQKTRCDILGCKTYADYSVLNDNDRIIFNVCKSCANELYSTLGHIVKPKSIPSPFRKTKGGRTK